MAGDFASAQRLLDFAAPRQSLEDNAYARTVTEIRAAQLLQFRGLLVESRCALEALVDRCRGDAALAALLDFALQHLGKVHFDARSYAQALPCFSEALELRKQKGNADLVQSTQLALDATRARMGEAHD